MQGETSCLLLANPSNKSFPWCPKDKTTEELRKLSQLIQVNAQNSSFHIDSGAVPGFLTMSSNFSDEAAKICFVAARPTTTLRRYLRIVAERFSDSKRNFSPEHIISECLDLVPRGCMTMDILFPGFTAHFLKNGLYHFVVSVYKKKPVGIANVSFVTGAYAAVDSGPPPFSMDPDQGREDVFRQLVYTPAELEKGELDYKTKCKESTKSLERTRFMKKQTKEIKSHSMRQNRKRCADDI